MNWKCTLGFHEWWYSCLQYIGNGKFNYEHVAKWSYDHDTVCSNCIARRCKRCHATQRARRAGWRHP